MSQEQRNSRFILEHARITRIKPLPKVVFIGVSCFAGKYPNSFDLTCFDLAAAAGLEVGDVMTISGDLSMRKPKEGDGPWQLQLIARSMKPGDKAKAPPPRESRGRREETQREPEPGDPLGDDEPPF